MSSSPSQVNIRPSKPATGSVGAVPPPTGRPAAVPGAPSVISGSISARAGLFSGTPGRMRLWGAVGVLMAILIGLVCINSLVQSKAAVDRAANNTAQVVRIQQIKGELLRADAQATTAFLVGGMEPAAVRAEYDRALREVGTLIARGAAEQPADADALGALTRYVQDYTAAVEQARSYNRVGLPVGAQYLKEGSAALRGDAVRTLEALSSYNESRANTEFSATKTEAYGLIAIAAILVLIGVAIWLARRTHRYLNKSLTAAIVLLGGILVVTVTSIGSISSATAIARDGVYTKAVAMANVRTAANDAQANEALTLIARGSGKGYEQAWQANATMVSEQLKQADAGSTLKRLWTTYADSHQQMRKADNDGNWESAVAMVTGNGPTAKAFTAFYADLDGSVDIASRAAVDRLNGIGSNTIFVVIVIGLGSLIGAYLVYRGIAQRLEDYR